MENKKLMAGSSDVNVALSNISKGEKIRLKSCLLQAPIMFCKITYQTYPNL